MKRDLLLASCINSTQALFWPMVEWFISLYPRMKKEELLVQPACEMVSQFAKSHSINLTMMSNWSFSEFGDPITATQNSLKMKLIQPTPHYLLLNISKGIFCKQVGN